MASPVGRATHEAPAPEHAAVPEHHRFSWRVKRAGLICAMMLASGNAWIGSPLAALWVGSRVQGSGPPAMSAIGVVAVVMGALSFTIIRLLNMLSVAYDRLLGLPARRRRQSPWMRSLRGEREDFTDPERARLSAVEVIVVATVIIAVVAFEIWFFFFSTSPIDQRSGR
jgi:hypothetical protein